jgi:prepilin-type N-terminal cleavage/methylation domain-containing protein
MNKKGFTLVEAVVVAAIVAILAAVAIPMYAGMIHDQKQTTVNNLAETAAASANAFLRRTGTHPINIDVLQLYYDNTKYDFSIPSNGCIQVNETGSSIYAVRNY